MKHFSTFPYVKAALVILIFGYLISSPPESYSQIWEKIDGTNPYVNRIFFDKSNPDVIAVASDSIPMDLDEADITFWNVESYGLLISRDGGQTFGDIKLDKFMVLDIVQAIDDSNTWYASYVNKGRGNIAFSSDAGETWDTDYSDCDGSFKILKLAATNTTDRFFGACVNSGNGIRTSDDAFVSCEANVSINISSRDIEISSINPNMIYAASDDNFTGQVFRSNDNGETWKQDSSGIDGLRIHCVQPSGINPAIVYCGADSVATDDNSVGKGIYQSLDSGSTWRIINAIGDKVYDLAVHPVNPNFLAAACGRAGVFVSGNAGFWWERKDGGFPDDVDVRTVSIPGIPPTDDGVIVYAGTFGQGMFKSKHITTDVNIMERGIDSGIEIVSISQLSGGSSLNVKWRSKSVGSLHIRMFNIRLFDALGRTITGFDYSSGGTEHSAVIEINNPIHYQVCFIAISSGSDIAIGKILVSR